MRLHLNIHVLPLLPAIKVGPAIYQADDECPSRLLCPGDLPGRMAQFSRMTETFPVALTLQARVYQSQLAARQGHAPLMTLTEPRSLRLRPHSTDTFLWCHEHDHPALVDVQFLHAETLIPLVLRLDLEVL